MARQVRALPIGDNPAPAVGELWAVEGGEGLTNGIYLGGRMWNVLIWKSSEFTLQEEHNLLAIALFPIQPASLHWEHQFDALALANGVDTTWAREISVYRLEGFQRGITAQRKVQRNLRKLHNMSTLSLKGEQHMPPQL